MATAGAASFRMTGRSGPTVREAGVPATLVMAPEATGAPGRVSTSGSRRAAVSGFVVVQRVIGGVHQRLERGPVAWMNGDADADGEGRLLAVPRHPLGHPPRHVPCRGVARLGRHQGELVPAEAGGGGDAAAGAE